MTSAHLADYSTLHVRVDDGIVFVTLDRPDKRNALSDEVIGELSHVVGLVSDTAARRAMVLRGSSGVFSAGGDLSHLDAIARSGDRDRIVAMNRRFGSLLELLADMDSTLVAVVEGAAVAGGLGLVCVADVVISEASARFALTETTLGLVPGQVAPVMARRIGSSVTRRLALTGARFDAVEAARLGLVDYVTEDIDQALGAVLRDISRCAPSARAVTKRLVKASRALPLSAALDMAAEDFADSLLSEEAAQGISAFMSKDVPPWASATQT